MSTAEGGDLRAGMALRRRDAVSSDEKLSGRNTGTSDTQSGRHSGFKERHQRAYCGVSPIPTWWQEKEFQPLFASPPPLPTRGQLPCHPCSFFQLPLFQMTEGEPVGRPVGVDFCLTVSSHGKQWKRSNGLEQSHQHSLLSDPGWQPGVLCLLGC